MIDVNSSLRIPLLTSGTKVRFQTRVPTKHELATCEHVLMTSSHPWNPTEVVMIQQATHQGGRNNPWKRQVSATYTFHKQYEYLEADSNEALLDSIDPSLARTAEVLQENRMLAQANTIYDQVDMPAHRTFVSDERHVKVSAELIAERFGIGPTRAQRTLRVTTQ